MSAAASLINEPMLKQMLDAEIVRRERHPYLIKTKNPINAHLSRNGGQVTLWLVQMPHSARLVIDNPREEIWHPGVGGETDENLIRRILRMALASFDKRTDIDIDAQRPPEGLMGVIGDCLLHCSPALKNPNFPSHSLVVFAPSEVSNPTYWKNQLWYEGFSGPLWTAVRRAMVPLLSLIPQGGLRFEAMNDNAHPWQANSETRPDYLFVANTFTLSGTSGRDLNVIEQMKVLSSIEARIAAFGVDPEPILKAISV